MENINVRWTTVTHKHTGAEYTSAFGCLAAECERHEHNGVLTANHSQSSYGLPVLIDSDGRVWTAQEMDGAELYKTDHTEPFTSSAACDAYLDSVGRACKAGYNVL